MKRSDFLKSSLMLGAGLATVPKAFSNETLNIKKVPKISKDEAERKYIGALDLSQGPESNTYQLLIASQLYGTFFGIFGHFDVRESKEKDHKEIHSIDLEIINYKGVVNIGFPNDGNFEFLPAPLSNPENPYINGYDPNEEHRILVLSVRAPSASGNSRTRKMNFEADPIKVRKNEIIRIERLLFPISDSLSIDKPGDDGSSQGKDIVDTEFIYRDGMYEDKRSTRPGKKGHVPRQYEEDPRDLLPSKRCHQSHMKIVF